MKTRGFTLIELLVVIAIIGLLAALSVVAFSSASAKGRDAKRKNDLRAVQKALELYYDNNGSYPNTTSVPRGTCASYGSYPVTGAGAYIPGLAPQYIAKLPTDPSGRVSSFGTAAGCVASQACYIYYSNGAHYKLAAICAIESTVPSTDSFYDVIHPTYAYNVCDSDLATCNSW